MTITFGTHDVSCPWAIEDMMLHAFIVQKTLTMYDAEYWVIHSPRVPDEDGDDWYHINIYIASGENLNEYAMREIKDVVDHFNTRDYCVAKFEDYL